MKYIYKICGKVSLVCYILMLYQLWHLCQYGRLRHHLPMLAFYAVSCGVTFLLWLIARRHFRKNTAEGSNKPKVFYIEALAFATATVLFCGGIVYSAIPYHGALSWKIDDFLFKKEVTLEHNNLFDDGVEGILTDLDNKLDLPEELYTGSFQVAFDASGTVQRIETFLYGKNKTGTTKTYLVDYDASKGNRMTVWLDGFIPDSYDEDMRLAPMLRILETEVWKEQVSVWSLSDKTRQYELYYAGRRAFTQRDGLHYLSGDADGDKYETGSNCLSNLSSGGSVVGFEVSLHIPESDEITPIRYIMEPVYHFPEELNEEHTAQQIEQAQGASGWTVDPDNGSMYFFLDDSLGWRLSVADAAAGSRFYIMEKTINGGASWNVYNEDPFLGQSGTAEGLIFFDKHLGIAGLANASQTYSALYLSNDGGKTFQKITLPTEQVTKLPDTAAEYGLTLQDYTYLNMPERNGDTLTITVTPSAGETDGIVFSSADNGNTWTYQGVSKEKRTQQEAG